MHRWPDGLLALPGPKGLGCGGDRSLVLHHLLQLVRGPIAQGLIVKAGLIFVKGGFFSHGRPLGRGLVDVRDLARRAPRPPSAPGRAARRRTEVWTFLLRRPHVLASRPRHQRPPHRSTRRAGWPSTASWSLSPPSHPPRAPKSAPPPKLPASRSSRSTSTPPSPRWPPATLSGLYARAQAGRDPRASPASLLSLRGAGVAGPVEVRTIASRRRNPSRDVLGALARAGLVPYAKINAKNTRRVRTGRNHGELLSITAACWKHHTQLRC